jgi:hypothetical protein
VDYEVPLLKEHKIQLNGFYMLELKHLNISRILWVRSQKL